MWPQSREEEREILTEWWKFRLTNPTTIDLLLCILACPAQHELCINHVSDHPTHPFFCHAVYFLCIPLVNTIAFITALNAPVIRHLHWSKIWPFRISDQFSQNWYRYCFIFRVIRYWFDSGRKIWTVSVLVPTKINTDCISDLSNQNLGSICEGNDSAIWIGPNRLINDYLL